MGGRIEINDERYKRQKEVVAHLKYDEARAGAGNLHRALSGISA
jgi:hypothetical protein